MGGSEGLRDCMYVCVCVWGGGGACVRVCGCRGGGGTE